MIGCIEVIAGCMYGGKTEELIRRLRRVGYARVSYQLFKPACDDRYDTSAVVTHLKDSLPGTPVQKASEILEHLHPSTRVVGIDEVQFFDKAIIEVCTAMANRGVRVIVAGLDRDSQNKPFGPMPELLALAEHVTKTSAICTVCGEPAHFSQVTVPKEGVVLVAGADKYQARCRLHFTPA